ncbi:Hypothetical protein Tcol_2137 [Trichococcus collinsii]|nr:Hypothetical protein Tcol_2137 [Trichococcus collinsii]
MSFRYDMKNSSQKQRMIVNARDNSNYIAKKN